MTAFHTLIRNILGAHEDPCPLCSFDVTHHFRSDDVIQKTNAAFLIVLSGPEHPLSESAANYLDRADGEYAQLLKRGLALLRDEIGEQPDADDAFSANVRDAADYTTEALPLEWNERTRKAVWQVFFPEGVDFLAEHDADIARLREKRRIGVTQLNGNPLSAPAKELLFTSNILLTVPGSDEKLQQAGLPENLTARIRDVANEKQLYWFDHPVQIGVETARNEVIYGLRGLNNALAFEKTRGNMESTEKATCVLSASVTHEGLHRVTKEYLAAEFAKVEPFEHLNVYIFTEAETMWLIDNVLAPAAATLLPGRDISGLRRVFGVDGEYGRHYSFLKAVAAFWQVLINAATRATFKIDLDQVFPQDVLVETTGMSAFEHYMSPLWGARGTDTHGNEVELGMLAGALVNEKDIPNGLYTTDVPFPTTLKSDEGVFFMSGLTMAASTEAEMGTRYGSDDFDGTNTCLQRVHVTGGTNGILVDALRRHRPFTPSFIGRAEDQAYLMSVLYRGAGPYLRYVHRDGLVMRHDKYAFAGEALEAARIGRQTGDLVRVLYFSSYARSLPWSLERTKAAFDPFTGCFISRIPITVTFLRLCMGVAEKCEQGDPLAAQLTSVAAHRVGEALDNTDLSDDYRTEREAWDLYYDILDALEKGGTAADPIRDTARQFIAGCRIGA